MVMGKGEDRGLWLSGSFTVKSAWQSHKVIHSMLGCLCFLAGRKIDVENSSVVQGKIPCENQERRLS